MTPTARFLFGALAFAALLGTATTSALLPLPSVEPGGDVGLVRLATYSSGIFGNGGAEIVAHDALTQRLYVVNAGDATVDVLSIRDPSAPALVGRIDLSAEGGSVNSVAAANGLVAVVQNGAVKTAPGALHLYAADLARLARLEVGSVPDMVTFTPDGLTILVANEGEPLTYCAPGLASDAEGSVSVVDVAAALAGLPAVRTAGFGAFAAVPEGVRVFGPNATIAQDLEPEYLAVSADGKTAWATLQENNALAVVDVASATVTALLPLGTKDHSLPGQGLDASDREISSSASAINVASWPVAGLHMPDGIAAYEADGETFLVTANEGDARADWPCYNEEARVSTLALDPVAFPDAAALKANAKLGRLTVSRALADPDHDGDVDVLQAFGSRGFSIRSADGALLYDSGDAFERITAAAYPASFNAGHDDPKFDSRSDNKGPEPEGVVVGRVAGRALAFVGLERIGGVVVYDVSDPTAPSFVQYVNHRDFAQPVAQQGDLGPEGLAFIPASESPTCEALLVVSNEVSGTTTIFAVRGDARPVACP